MSRTIAGIVQAARDRHPYFDAERQPTGPIYRYLADCIQELQNMVLGLLPEYTQTETTTTATLPLADFAAGIALDPCRFVTEVVAVDPDTAAQQQEHEVELIAAEDRFTINQRGLAAWQDGDTVFLRGPADRWSSFGSIEIRSVPVFGDADADALQLPGATLPLPDAAAPAVSARLASFMAERAEGLDPMVVDRFAKRAGEATTAFMQHVTDRLIAGGSFVTRDVMGE